MFRYDQNVQNRDEVPPSTAPWTSSSPLITTVVTVGSTYERISAFWVKNKKIIISGVLTVLVISSVATTSGIFMSRAGSHQDNQDSGIVPKEAIVEAPVDTLQLAGQEVHKTHHHKAKKYDRQYQNPTTTTASSTEKTSKVVTAKSVVAVIHRPESSVNRSEDSGRLANNSVEHGTGKSSLEGFTTTPSANTGDVDKVVTPEDMISKYDDNTTTSTTTTPAPTTPKPCDRDPGHHKRAWNNITEKNPISVLNEMDEVHSFTFESCNADGHKTVFRSTILLVCDESHYTSGFALRKQKSKELAARAACESIYKIKFTKDLEPDFPSAQDCKAILSVNE